MKAVWRWLAKKANVEAKLLREEWLSAWRLGAPLHVMERPEWMPVQTYKQMVSEIAAIVYEYTVEGRRRSKPQLAAYEPPEKQTDSQLRRIAGTEHLPAMPGDLLRKYNQHQAGK